MNQIGNLLAEVLATGKVPTVTAVADVVDRGTSTTDRHAARTKIYRAAKQIVQALDSGLPDQAEQLVTDTADELGEFTSGGDTSHNPRELADKISAEQHTRKPAGPKPDIAPLRELLTLATRNGLAASDLDKVRTRTGATAEQVQQWRSDVLADARKINQAYAAGNQGLARRMAAEAAVEHSDLLAAPERVDPAEGVDDPRELAALVSRRNQVA